MRDFIEAPQPTSVCCIFGTLGRAFSWDPTRPIASWEESEGGLDRSRNEFRDVDPTGALAGQAGAAGVDADNWRDQGFYRGQSMDQAAGRLGGTADYFGRIAQGQDSVSALQLRQALQQNQAAQSSLAAGARGSSAPMAARTAAIQSARLGAGLAGQQAMAGLQERQQAAQLQQQALMGQGNLYGQARGQDLNASLGSRQNALSGYNSIEQQRGNRYNALLGTPTPAEQGLASAMSVAQLIAGSGGGGTAGAAGGGGGGAMMQHMGMPALGMMSDIRAKEDIRPGAPQAGKFLDSLNAYSYRYRPEHETNSARPVRLGVMAQDLQRTPMGARAVADTPRGKVVDQGQLTMGLAAGLAELNRRMKMVEKGQ